MKTSFPTAPTLDGQSSSFCHNHRLIVSLSMTFETPVLQGSDRQSERSNVIAGSSAIGAAANGRRSSIRRPDDEQLMICLPAAVLRRKAVVYVRQSTQTQVQTNLESQASPIRSGGGGSPPWIRPRVEVIDDDLGRSASGMVANDQALIASSRGFAPAKSAPCLCFGRLTACPQRTRLAPPAGAVRPWSKHGSSTWTACTTHVAPKIGLLLGMKGSISEFELGVLRARMFEAARAKAPPRRSCALSVPIGYIWHREIRTDRLIRTSACKRTMHG